MFSLSESPNGDDHLAFMLPVDTARNHRAFVFLFDAFHLTFVRESVEVSSLLVAVPRAESVDCADLARLSDFSITVNDFCRCSCLRGPLRDIRTFTRGDLMPACP